MKWKLWLDDDALKEGIETFRNPPPDDDSWLVANTARGAIALIETFGPPEFIDFDHDLGPGDDAMTLCKWLYENHRDVDFAWHVHSRNPAGALNIDAYLNSWMKSRRLP